MVKFFITDYLNFHAEEKHNSLSRKQIFRPKPTGIGDRFERLMTAYYVAVVTKRVLLVDWQRPSPIEDLLETAYHGTDLFLRDVDRSEKPGMARSDGGNEFVLDKTQNHDPNKFIDTLNSNITNIVMTMTKRPLRSTLELLGHQRFAHTGKRQLTAFYGSYICRKAVMHRVLRVRTDFFENMSSKGIQLQFKSVQNADNIKSLFKNGYIGVHARVGVGLHEIGDRFDAIQDNLEIPPKCLARRVSRLAAISDALKLPIFLATDTVPFREIFIREVQNMSNGTVEIFHGKWNVLHSYLHIDMEREPLNETQKKINIKTQKMMETYADLAILGNAAHIIALRSSFVRFAFSIGSASSLAQINIENCLAAKISTYT